MPRTRIFTLNIKSERISEIIEVFMWSYKTSLRQQVKGT
jgi:hypothetical protein